MENILQTILAAKRQEVARRMEALPLEVLANDVEKRALRPVVSMRKALTRSRHGIIAEFKRCSPSKGKLNYIARVPTVISAYVDAGAIGCSILTDEQFFGGSLDDLADARCAVKAPLLRKDFIINEYQLYEARLWGADTVILIASALTRLTCLRLGKMARNLGMEVLLEIRDHSEIDYMNPFVDILGVNNRDLITFNTGIERSLEMIEDLRPMGIPVISESGIDSPDTARQLLDAGFDGMLIGELLMKTISPARTLEKFIAEV